MLKFLSVENFALIDRLEIEFQKGLTPITGETGSGKSILVDAVGLLVGERASQEMVRQGCDKANIEGIFQISSNNPAREHLKKAGIPLENQNILIRREISLTNINKVFINNTLCTQGLLSRVGMFLSDIHGQHEQQRLLDSKVQLEYLDVFGGLQNLVTDVVRSFRDLKHIRSQLQKKELGAKERHRQIETLQFQVDEIETLQLNPELHAELRKEERLLSSAEQRLLASRQAYQLLYEQEESLLTNLVGVQKQLEHLATDDPDFKPLLERLQDLRYQLEELAYHLRDYSERIQFNPARLEAIQKRLSEIHKVCRKYDQSADNLLDYLEQIKKELSQLSKSTTQINELKQLEKKLEKNYIKQASQLSQKRHDSVHGLIQKMQKELSELDMKNTALRIRITSREKPAEKGIDNVEFLISANPGEEPKPLLKIASGGELSRTVLALKSIVTLEDYPKTLVFDEIDIGIGGQVASSIGKKLARLSNQQQVFCVTHLPQIACWASQHFHVDKQQSQHRTVIRIQLLKENARVEEISRMMSGKIVTETTRQHARELLYRCRSENSKKLRFVT